MKAKLRHLPVNLFLNLFILFPSFIMLHDVMGLSIYGSIILSLVYYIESSISMAKHDYLESKIDEINARLSK